MSLTFYWLTFERINHGCKKPIHNKTSMVGKNNIYNNYG